MLCIYMLVYLGLPDVLSSFNNYPSLSFLYSKWKWYLNVHTHSVCRHCRQLQVLLPGNCPCLSTILMLSFLPQPELWYTGKTLWNWGSTVVQLHHLYITWSICLSFWLGVSLKRKNKSKDRINKHTLMKN